MYKLHVKILVYYLDNKSYSCPRFDKDNGPLIINPVWMNILGIYFVVLSARTVMYKRLIEKYVLLKIIKKYSKLFCK